MWPDLAEDTTARLARPLTTADLAGLRPLRRLSGRNPTKADILVYRIGDAEIAVKDYAGRPWLVRQTLGRWLIGRETRAYRAAGALSGLPPFLGRLGACRLATAWIGAAPLHHVQARDVRPEWFERLGDVLDALHARGVALADLHRRDVLVAEDGRVWVLDLALACVLGPRPGRLRRRLFERARLADRVALVRMRARFTGADELQAIAALGRRAVTRYRRRQALKRWWNALRGSHRRAAG